MAPISPYAHWIRRVGASLIDGIVVLAIPVILVVAFFMSHQLTYAVSDHVVVHNTCTFSTTGISCTDGSFLSGRLGLLLILCVVWYLIWAAYVVVALARFGATVGMYALSIRIRRANDHAPIGYGRSLARYAVYLAFGVVGRLFPLLGLASLLDSLWPLWDSRRQTLHDKVVSTVALDARVSLSASRTAA